MANKQGKGIEDSAGKNQIHSTCLVDVFFVPWLWPLPVI